MSGESEPTPMPKERDEESGQFQEVYDRHVVEQAVRGLDQATTQQVADELGAAYQTAYMKLRELEDDADSPVESDRVGNVRVWSANEQEGDDGE